MSELCICYSITNGHAHANHLRHNHRASRPDEFMRMQCALLTLPRAHDAYISCHPSPHAKAPIAVAKPSLGCTHAH
eukprot:1835269-Pleurochrysis_carterae.AAC.1